MLRLLKESLNGLAIEIRSSGNGEGVLNEGLGADFVQKEKIVPRNFGSQDVGIRFDIAALLINRVYFGYGKYHTMILLTCASLSHKKYLDLRIQRINLRFCKLIKW